MWVIILSFLLGWGAGILGEYWYHWLMHKVPLLFHIRHHVEYFELSDAETARKARSLGWDMVYAALVFIVLSPAMLLVGVYPVLAFYCGAFFHLVIIYESAHSIIHDDSWLPRFIKNARGYVWWRGCHHAHHLNRPRGNFCVTCPLVDRLFGTYRGSRKQFESELAKIRERRVKAGRKSGKRQ